MSEVVSLEPSRNRVLPRRGQAPLAGNTHNHMAEFFSRSELNAILQVYSRRVMAGEWLDYAIGRDERGAVFEIFGHSANHPIFRIYKRNKPLKRSGRFQVLDRHRVLKTGQSVKAVLDVIDNKRPRLVYGS